MGASESESQTQRVVPLDDLKLTPGGWRKNRGRFNSLVLVFSGLLFPSECAYAQSLAELQGTVRDRTGGVMIGAVATLTTHDSSQTTTTDAQGRYHFSGVAPLRNRIVNADALASANAASPVAPLFAYESTGHLAWISNRSHE